MKIRFNNERGFTLIEVIVVLALIGLVAVLVLPRGLREAPNAAALEAEAQNLAGVIRLARQQAILKGSSSAISIKKDLGQYTLISTGKTYTINDRITISDLDLGGGTDITFWQDGMWSAPSGGGLVTLTDGTDSIIITISSLGTVDIQ